jgi:hypothetical protein
MFISFNLFFSSLLSTKPHGNSTFPSICSKDVNWTDAKDFLVSNVPSKLQAEFEMLHGFSCSQARSS